MRTVHTASALLIGNELLNGKVQEQNLFTLASTLRALGISLCKAVVLGDDVAELARELSELKSRHDLVVTSGGVGPTHDDVTFEAVALAFGVARVPHPTLTALLEAHYGERLMPGHLAMANVPLGAQLLGTSEVVWPTVVLGNVWVFPGVPELFRMKLVVLREHVRGPGPFHSRSVFTKLDEGHLKATLDRVVAANPNVEVGSYPKWFDATYTTKITLDGRDASEVERALQQLLSQLPEGEPQAIDEGPGQSWRAPT
jgi:molybdenum cofactor synthesis domain-containing protein